MTVRQGIAGIQDQTFNGAWIPAFAGMTSFSDPRK
jgi:hypothetical protein